MSEPCPGLAELEGALGSGALTSVELVERCLARADALDPELHLLRQRRDEAARREATESDTRRTRGESLSDLDGIPIIVKDNIAQAGDPCGCASRILEGYVSPFDATVIEKLRAAGAVILARANMDEFAMGSSTENSAYGETRNPWDTTRSPGGSSGGSAVAVATGVVPVALGSDTGGSIRQPASFCGVTGFKPTYGRVSRWGLVAFASSLDQIGPFGRSAADCAALYDVIAGHDERDSTSLPEPAPRALALLDGDVSGLVIGLPRECFVEEGADPRILDSVRDAVAGLERAGAKVQEVSLPHARHAVATYYLICTAEASSNLARFDGIRYGHRATAPAGLTDLYERSRSEGFGREVKRRILLGTFVLSAGYYDAYYRKAQQLRTLLRRDIERATESCDVLITPTTPEVAFRIGEKTADPLTMYLSDIYTVLANLAGVPAVSVPCGLVDELPAGMQILGRPLDDTRVLRLADAHQRISNFHTLRPSKTS